MKKKSGEVMSEVMLKNYMEDCVLDMMPSVLDTMDICKCDKCQKDIMAYALNQLPPKYIATRKGHVFAKIGALNIQYEANVATALSTGAKIVGDNPRHD